MSSFSVDWDFTPQIIHDWNPSPRRDDMDATQFLEGLRNALAELLGMAADELAEFFNEGQVQALAAEFLATGDDDQLELIAFRFRTWGRRQNLAAIIAASSWLSNGILLAGNLVGELLERVPRPT